MDDEQDPPPLEAPSPAGETSRTVAHGEGYHPVLLEPATAEIPEALAPEDLEVGLPDEGDPGEDETPDDEPDPQGALPISPLDLAKVRAVFVPSREYEEAARHGFRQVASHVFLVLGPEHSGKPTCAIHLGWDLLGRPDDSRGRLWLYRDDEVRIIDFVLARNIEPRSVFIVEDAIGAQVWDQDLLPPRLEALEAALQERGAYLILTAEPWPGAAQVAVPKIGAAPAPSDLEEIFKGHLDFYAGAGGSVTLPSTVAAQFRERWPDVGSSLTEPYQIDQLCHRMGLCQGTITPEVFAKIAAQVASEGRQDTRPWFNDLKLHEQLFVLLHSLLGGLDRRALLEVYGGAVERLRAEGMAELPDLRTLGQEELLDRARMVDKMTGRLGFCARSYENEARHQVGNRHALLWSLVPFLVKKIEDTRGGDLRRSLAYGLATLGMDHRAELRVVVEQLAASGDTGIGVVSCFILSELDRRAPGSHAWIIGLLEEWVRSGRPRLMWAAGAACWRLYSVFGQTASPFAGAREEDLGSGVLEQARAKLVALLGDLACAAHRMGPAAKNQAWQDARRASRDEREARQRAEARLRAWGRSTFRSAQFALLRIAAIDPAMVVSTLAQWLMADHSPGQRRLAHAVSGEMFESAGGRKGGASPARREDLLQLVGPLLQTARDNAGALPAMLGRLRRWLEGNEEPDQIALTLFRAVNRLSSPEVMAALRSVLVQEWLDCSSPRVKRLARALIDRLWALEGIIAESEPGRQALLIIDASPGVLAGPASLAGILKLWRALKTWIDPALGILGSRILVAPPGAPLDPARLRSGHSHPRLLLPVLEALGTAEVHLVILVTGGEVLDLEDVRDLTWARSLILLSAGDGQAAEGPWSTFAFDPSAPAAAVTKLLTRVQQLRLEDLIAGRAAGSVPDCIPGASPPESRTFPPVELLEAWVDALDLSLPDGGDELGGRILRAIHRLAGQDLQLGCRLARTWMEAEPGGLRTRMGSAAGRLLVRLLSLLPAPPLRDRAAVMELCRRLVEGGGQGAEVVFATAGRWLRDPAWAAMLAGDLPGNGGELARWIQTLPFGEGEAIEKTLDTWSMEAGGRPGDGASERIAETAWKLKRLLALRAAGVPGEEAEAGEGCVLLVVDPSSCGAEGARILEEARQLVSAPGRSLPVVLGRLGERLPQRDGNSSSRLDALRPDGRKPRPRLLGPLLETVSPVRVSRVLLLAAGEVHDLADFAATGWRDLIIWCGPADAALPPGIARLDPAFGAEKADAIRRYLQRGPATQDGPEGLGNADPN